MKFAYQRAGGPIVTWGKGGFPRQTRAADAVSLGCAPCAALLGMGSLAGSTLDRPTLPAPGAPEPVGVSRGMPLSGVSCKCGGSCGCKYDGLSGVVESIPGGYVTIGLGAAFLLMVVMGSR